jgi:Flp pilus assembly protein TadB
MRGDFTVLIKMRLGLTFLLILPSLLLANAMLSEPQQILPGAIVAALLLQDGSARLWAGRQERTKLLQFQRLLSHLASRLSAGHTLELALIESEEALTPELGPKSPLIISLGRLKRQLQAHVSLKAALIAFSRSFACERAEIQLAILPALDRQGGRGDIFLRRSHDALSRELAMYRDVTAEQSQTSSEAVVLCILPFILALGLRGDAITEGTIETIRFAVYLFSVAAIYLVMRILAPAADKSTRCGRKKKKRKKKSKAPPRLLSTFYLRILPFGIGYRLRRIVSAIFSGDDNPFEDYLLRKREYLLLGGGVITAVFILGIIPPFILPPSLLLPAVIQDIMLIRREQERRLEFGLVWPVLLNLLTVLLESGLTLEKSLILLPTGHLDRAQGSPGFLIRRARRRVMLGNAADSAVAELADACPIPDMTSALRLIARYGKEGGRELLEIVSLSAEQSWQHYRLSVRRRLARRSLLLLAPMAIDLFAVIVTAILPAVASIRAF